MNAALIEIRPEGLYCPPADAYIDPWRPVDRALITHAHADHARSGSRQYYAAACGEGLLRKRLGDSVSIRAVEYAEPISLGHAAVSFHPAGHILGSAQIRIEAQEQVWVVSGDYKRDPDPTCAPLEVVPCDTFITEATFGLPIYRWQPTPAVVGELYRWWQRNRDEGRASVVFAYALGKAQRLLAELLRYTDEPVVVHGAVHALTEIYRAAGVAMVETETIVAEQSAKTDGKRFAGRLIVAPPSANGTPWMKRFGACATGFCSGWMRVRGQLRRRGYDKGFVISDHADWPGLVRTIEQTGASRVLATHGNSSALVRYLRQQGTAAESLETFGDESSDLVGGLQ